MVTWAVTDVLTDRENNGQGGAFACLCWFVSRLLSSLRRSGFLATHRPDDKVRDETSTFLASKGTHAPSSRDVDSNESLVHGSKQGKAWFHT